MNMNRHIPLYGNMHWFLRHDEKRKVQMGEKEQKLWGKKWVKGSRGESQGWGRRIKVKRVKFFERERPRPERK